MEFQNYTLPALRQDITDNTLHVKAIIQDILSFRGSLTELEILNEAGRSKLSALRKFIQCLDDWAHDEGSADLSKEVDQYREQFSKTLQSFRKANISTVLEIEKANRDELLAITGEQSLNELKQRNTRHIQTGLISQQDNVTEKMLAISRHLSETTQKSASTLETLALSSQSVEGTKDELHNTAGTITKSGKLLRKYGRRECTDKILLFFAFIFFLACVFYIVQKRLF